MTGGAVPLGDPNTATHLPHTNSDQSEVSQHQAPVQHNVVGGDEPRPPPGGGKPHGELFQTVASNKFGSTPALSEARRVPVPVCHGTMIHISKPLVAPSTV